MISKSAPAFALAALAIGVTAAPAPANPTVTCSQGTIIGTTTSLPSATIGVNKYLGIPFADTPPKRFLPPEAHPGFTEPFHADTPPAACLQQFNCKKFEVVKISN